MCGEGAKYLRRRSDGKGKSEINKKRTRTIRHKGHTGSKTRRSRNPITCVRTSEMEATDEAERIDRENKVTPCAY
jgi:hypothetical protein